MLGDNDYLQKRAAELGLERGEQLQKIQAHLDGLYPGQVRAVSLNDGVLRLVTPSASVASELRMGQVELLTRVSLSNTRLAVSVATIMSG